MSRSTDFAPQRRPRRLVLTALGPLLMLVVPMLLVGLLGERLPDHVTVNRWSFDTRIGFTWQSWSAQPVFGMMVWMEALIVVSFLSYWRVPVAQRVLVAVSFVVGLTIPVACVMWWLGLVDVLGGAARPGWPMVVETAGTLGAFALGWLVAGPLPSPPEAESAPPPYVNAMALGPWQRVMFVTSAWSVRRLLIGALLAAAAVWVAVQAYTGWLGVVLLALWAVVETAQARTRLQIDDSGVTMTLPWLQLRRTIPWARIRFAEARPKAPEGSYKLADGGWGWGAVTGRGPVLVLSLADDRSFVYSTQEAGVAAALVNGWLNRQRRGEAA
ncbi:hypothetical protein [Nonomuraea guangzhouensis]|uniref:DUF1648 domain-containing protein n=1 Tax=Nonomuraea guangzhouensis TaxID=1291555 RepID=A0ABW4G644_9ACTN|nr:hypothetical protein [Nonomuraea guangzhouensis]